MPFPGILNSMLNPAAGKPSSPPPLPLPNFPLWLSFTLPKITKPHSFGSTDHVLCHFFAGSVCVVGAIITSQLISQCMHGSQMNNDSIMLGSTVTRFLKGLLIRDSVAWENLPQELWREIGIRLVSRLDIISFRSVCKLLRSSLPLPTRFPLLVPPPPNCDRESPYSDYYINEVSVCCTQGASIHVAFEEVGQGGGFQVLHSYRRGASQLTWPMISFMESPKNPLSQLSFVGRAHHLRMAPSRLFRVKGGWCFSHTELTKKIVLISSSADSVNPSYARASELSVVAHLSQGELTGRLALLRLGGPSKNWDWDTNFSHQVFQDIATYRGQLCVLDVYGRVFVMDYNSLQMTLVACPPFNVDGMNQKHLFEYCGDLYVSVQKHEDIVSYKLSLQLQKWIKVEIGNHLSALAPYLV